MLAWLVACAPGTFTAAEADVVYEAVSSVNADTYAAIYAFSAPEAPEDTSGGDTGGLADASAKGLTWHTAADGGTFSGAVAGPGSWTGTVQVDGTYAVELVDLVEEEWVVVWSLDATYVDVDYGDLGLGGDITWKIRAESDGSLFTHTSAVTGDVVARGAATGAGAVDYATTVSLSGGRYQVSTVGEVGGHDISAAYDATAFGL